MRGRKLSVWLWLPGGLLVAGLALLWFSLRDLPDVADVTQARLRPTVRIVDRQGRTLYDVVDATTGRHHALPLAAIPPALQQATIAVEDREFYAHPGVDWRGILRAGWINLRGGEVVAGGSTITQQVARNVLLSADERAGRTMRRKLRESWLAWRLSRRLPKGEVLAIYLNQTYYGGLAYGVEAAAQTYFGKPAADLTLAESALIAGLPQAPAAYNPLVNPDAARRRQETVLRLMETAGFITAAQRELAAREPLRLAAEPYPVVAPHFVMMVQRELDGLLPAAARAARPRLTVRTTLDREWQAAADRIVREQLQELQAPPDGRAGHAAHNAALVALDPATGAVRALVGSPDYFDPDISGAVNMALAPRQPGSALKPFIYAAALAPESGPGWTAATMLADVSRPFPTGNGGVYVPVNFDHTDHGPVLLRQALAASLNVPAVATLAAVGVDQAVQLGRDLGLTTLENPGTYDLTLALGGGPVRLLDLAAAYGALANGGRRVQPRLILAVEDAAGHPLATPAPAASWPVLDPRVAWLISDILSDDDARSLSFGRHSLLQLDRPAAVKTGTTNDFRDNWTVGYTPSLVVGVWVGNADNSPMRAVTGISGAGPIWHAFMRTVLAGQPAEPFNRPDGLVRAEVCALSGLRPTAACPYRRQEWFLAGTAPAATDTFFVPVAVDAATGLAAGPETAASQTVPRLALDLPPLFHDWARSEGYVLLSDLARPAPETTAAAAAAAQPGLPDAPVSALRLVAPLPGVVYRLSAALPAAAQQLRLEAQATGDMSAVTLWLDGQLLASEAAAPYAAHWPLSPGRHRAWAEGVDGTGRRLVSEVVSFAVRAVGEE